MTERYKKKRLDKPCRSDTVAKGLKFEDGVIDDSVWKNTLWAMAYCTRVSSILIALETVNSKAEIVKASLHIERIVKACRPFRTHLALLYGLYLIDYMGERV